MLFLILLLNIIHVWNEVFVENPIQDQNLESNEHFEFVIPDDVFGNTGDSRTLTSLSSNEWTKSSFVNLHLESQTFHGTKDFDEIIFSENFAFSLENSGLPAIWMIEFSSDGNTPIKDTRLDLGIYNSIFSYFIEGNYLFMGQLYDVEIVDITDKMNQNQVSTITTPDQSRNYYLFVSDDILYVSSEVSYTDHYILLFNVTNMSDPQPLVSLHTRDWMIDIYGLYADGNWLYVIGDDTLWIWNVNDDGVSLTYAGNFTSSNDIIDDFYVSENEEYVYLIGCEGLEKIDVSNKYNPQLSSIFVDVPEENFCGTNVGKYNGFIFATYFSEDFEYDDIDISYDYLLILSEDLVLVGSAKIDYGTKDMAFFGDHLYLVSYNCMRVNDISETSNPFISGTFFEQGTFQKLHVDGKYAIALLTRMLIVYDIETINSPKIASFMYMKNPEDIYVEENYAYILSERFDDETEWKLQIFDISEKENIFLVGQVDMEDENKARPRWRVHVLESSDYAYVSWSEGCVDDRRRKRNGRRSLLSTYYSTSSQRRKKIGSKCSYLKIFNVTDKSNPVHIGDADDYVSSTSFDMESFLENYLAVLYRLDYGEIRFYDITERTNPIEISSIRLSQGERLKLVDEHFFFVADGWDGLKIIDASDVYNPQEIFTYHFFDEIIDLVVEGEGGNFLVTVLSSTSIYVLDISDLKMPVLVEVFEQLDEIDGFPSYMRLGKPSSVDNQGNYIVVGSANGLNVLRRSVKITGTDDFETFCGETVLTVENVELQSGSIISDSFVLSRPSFCSDHGTCLENHECSCDEGFDEGDYCEIWSCYEVSFMNFDQVCSGHGECTSYDVCECHDTWFGGECDESLLVLTLVYPTVFVVSVTFIICSILVCYILCILFWIGLGIFILFIGCCSCAVIKRMVGLRRYKKLEHFDLFLKEQELDQDKSVAHLRIDRTLFSIEIDEIKCSRILGEGGSSSVVFLAEWKKQTVAFKCFKTRQLLSTQICYDEFETEVKILASVSHPNVIQFFGATLKPPRVGIVMEFCENGDLVIFLNKKRNEIEEKRETTNSIFQHCYPLKEKLRMCLEICGAMDYLHTRRIIHRDMKLENVLVDANEKTKMMDFGLSRLVDRMSQVKTSKVGTSIFMAPEIVLSHEYDEKVDVFSFSIMMFIIFTENFHPYREMLSIEIKVANNPLLRPDVGEFEHKIPERFRNNVSEIVKKCWDHNPTTRYSFSELTEIFDTNMKNWGEEEETEKNILQKTPRKKFNNKLTPPPRPPPSPPTRTYHHHQNKKEKEIVFKEPKRDIMNVMNRRLEDNIDLLLRKKKMENDKLELKKKEINETILEYRKKIEKMKLLGGNKNGGNDDDKDW